MPCQIILKCPLSYDIPTESSGKRQVCYDSCIITPSHTVLQEDLKITVKSLAKLHYKLKFQMRIVRKCECLFDQTMDEVGKHTIIATHV